MTLFFFWFWIGFQNPPSQNPVMARCGDLEIRQDAFIAAQKLSQHIPSTDSSVEKSHQRDLLKRLMVQKIIQQDPWVHAHMQAPAFQNQVQLRVVQALAQKERQYLRSTIPPMPQTDLQAQFNAAKKASEEDLRITFRHITLRKDEKRKFASEQEVGEFADQLLKRLRAGEDFATLAKAHSQSATAINGGLVKNSRLKELDQSLADLFMNLDTGALSDVMPTRTGFHIFQLVRKAKPTFDEHNTKKIIRASWQEARFAQLQAQHLTKLRQRHGLKEVKGTLQSATWNFPVSFYLEKFPNLDRAEAKQSLETMLLLAEAALARSDDYHALKTHYQDQEHHEISRKLRNRQYQAFIKSLPNERIKTIHDANPKAFKQKATANIHLIFIPQGNDSFATKQRLEKLVAALRGGRNFNETAQALSKGPYAESGGDLGVLEDREWSTLHPKVDFAIRQMEPGQISDPIFCSGKRIGVASHLSLNDGFAIIKVIDKKPETVLAFEEAVPQVRQAYARQNRAALEKEWMEKLLQDHQFEWVQFPLSK